MSVFGSQAAVKGGRIKVLRARTISMYSQAIASFRFGKVPTVSDVQHGHTAWVGAEAPQDQG